MAEDVMPDLAARFAGGSTFDELLARPKENSEMWDALYKRAWIPADVAVRMRGTRGRWNLLVLNEDWCGDSLNILPHVARLAEAHPEMELRILSRDKNPDLMDAHLTGKSKSIPVVIVYDGAFTEIGWWGPRPRELQNWVMTEGLMLPKPERYRHIRSWYARDRGRAITSEILEIIENHVEANAIAIG